MFNSTAKNVIVSCLLVAVICVFGFFAAEYIDRGTPALEIDEAVEDTRLHVHFIDVGQGDCALVQTSDGNILIDAGTPESRNDIIRYVDSLGITEFEYAIFTHPHSDHIGSADKLIKKYKFNNIILPDAVSNTIFYENMLDAIEQEDCEVILGEAGKSIAIGGAEIDIFAPRSYYYPDDLNDMSIVAKLTYDDVSFLFTGDAEAFSERQMLKYECDVNVDILKVAHHGSSTSSCEEFLYAASPSIAIVSAGENNAYGHPHDEIVASFEERDIDMYITYEVGNIVVSTDGTTYEIITEKKQKSSD